MSLLTLALAISIYDSPSDKSKVVVEVCGPTQCARLLTDKATLEQDWRKIDTWVEQVEQELR